VELLVAGLFAGGVLLLFAGLAQIVSIPSRAGVVVGQYRRPLTFEEMELAQPFAKRVLRPALRRVAQIVTRYAPQKVVETTRLKLDLAGNPYDLPVLEFLGIRGVCTVLAALILGVIFSVLGASGIQILLFGLMGAFLGFYGPILWLDLKIRQRKEEILVSLPDALDLLTVCVEAGLGLDAAIAQVADKWNNQLSRALARMIVELRLGKPREVALRDLADKAGVRELTNFVGAILQAERFGAGIARVLRIQSEQQRVLRRQRAQDRANQLPVKLLFPLTFCIFPAVLIVILGPAMIRITDVFKP
jgi:tight adherence protein C